MKKLQLSIVLIFLLFTISVVEAQDDQCAKIRTVFEMGSGSVKAKKVKINVCNDTIIETLAQASKVMLLQKQIDESADKATLSKDTIDSLVNSIDALKQSLKVDCKKSKCAAVGTAALRKAKNSQEVIDILKNKMNISGFIIPQEEEGYLGYLSTLANISNKKSLDARNLMVLDIGGGSAQLVFRTKRITKAVIAPIGSQNFKAMVIEYVKNYSLADVSTPNPLIKPEIQKTKHLADQVIGKLFWSSPSARYLLENKNIKIIGIGNLLNKMIPSIFNKKKMTSIELSDIDNEIEKLVFKSDYFIANNYKSVYSEYTSEVVTDLILVSSIMHSLKLKKMQIIDIDNNDGILISDEYWQ